MKRGSKRRQGLWLGVIALVLALGIGIFGEAFSMVAYADSQGRITASSAKIRRSPTINSDMVAGAQSGEVLTVTGQVQGDDGYTWYKVVKGGQEGYVRGDLISVSDSAGVPSEGGEGTAAPVEVTPVNPVAATVKEENGRIRSEASVSGQILAEVQNGAALTVTGQAMDAEGKIWYQVSYASGESVVNGFIRSDYVNLSGELTPATGEPTEPEPTEPEPPVEVKQWDTALRTDGWYVYNTETNEGWGIEALINNAKSAVEANADNEKTIKNQKVILIVLVFLLVAAVAGIAYLVYKLRDVMDSAYFNAVENDTIRKRDNSKNRGGNQKVMHSVGTDKQPARTAQGQRPAGNTQGQRPAGSVQGQRPAGVSQGQRPAGTAQSQRPAGSAQGQRPAGVPQGQRPAGSVQGQRPAGTVQGQRPAGGAQGQRPAGTSQSQRPAGAPQGQRPAGAPQGQRSQPKNFMVDDDEFEYEYLNYDENDRS